MSVGPECLGVSLELKLDFEDNEILHVDNGKIQLHLAYATSRSDIQRKLTLMRKNPNIDNDFINKPFYIGGGVDLIYAGEIGELRTLDNLLKTGNQSEAGYFFMLISDGLIVLGQYIGVNKVSSQHRHTYEQGINPREFFFNAQKNLYLWKNEEEVIQVEGEAVIEPLETHAAFTIDAPAWSFIVQEADVFEHDSSGLVVPEHAFLRQKAIEQGKIAA